MSVSYVICVAGETSLVALADFVAATVGVPARQQGEAFTITTPAGGIWVNHLTNMPSDADFAFAGFPFEISMDGRGAGHHERITGTLWPIYHRLAETGHRLLFVQNMETLLAQAGG